VGTESESNEPPKPEQPEEPCAKRPARSQASRGDQGQGEDRGPRRRRRRRGGRRRVEARPDAEDGGEAEARLAPAEPKSEDGTSRDSARPRRRSRRREPEPPSEPEDFSLLDVDSDDDGLLGLPGHDEEEDDELPLEDELDVPLGAVFMGPVPLDTPEQRQEAMQKAARRLGIRRLYPEQEEVIDAALCGRDVLMVLPTGFGKSACYQIPSMILPRPVVVISPLLALMRDQYEKLQKLQVPCIRLDGTIRGGARRAALERIASGERVLVMTTPETLAAPDASEALAKSGVSMAAVDEAHCISEWGFDFRPAYLQIGERLRGLGAPPVLALTATATEKVRLAIQRFVGMRDPRIVASSPHRENLAFDVIHCGGGARHRALARLALRVRRPGIIYCSTTREVDEIYTILQRFGVPSHRYHGKMSASDPSKNQDGFMQRGRRTVMVATNAFGLGIDKPDIRYVMHYQSPASLEQYLQEAGRAGRDGRRANCIMLFSHEDRAIHEALLSRSRVRPEQLYRLGAALAAWAQEDKVPSLQALALSAELGVRTTGALLALLEEATLVRWDQTAVYVTVPADTIEARARELAGQFETLRTQDARRLDAVAEYASTQGCRAVFLRQYFGEGESEPCGMCDRCRGQEDRPQSFWQPLAPPKAETSQGWRRRGQRPTQSRQGARSGSRRNQKSRRKGSRGDPQASAARPDTARGGRPVRRRRGRRGRGRSRPTGSDQQPEKARPDPPEAPTRP
jgi:ATP-dependent DNA helicase RecQ